jgi:hypothetical protein
MSSAEIIFIILALVAGLLIGVLIASLAGGRTKEPLETPAPPAARAPVDAWVDLRRQYQERISLWVEKSSGRLVVRINGRMVDRPQQLNPEEMQQHQAYFKEWLHWLSMTDPASAGPHPHGASVLVTPAPAGAKPAASTVPAAAPASAVVPPATAAVPAAKSIVEQINAILQEMMLDSPASAKGVRLFEHPRDGVVVRVGLDSYNGIDAVPDAEVKALLKAAAAEWERRSRRG